MAQFNRQQVLEAMTSTGMVPVFYNPDAETGKKVLKACYDGGVRVFEFTNRGDKAAEVFPELVGYAKENLPGMIVGIGSISFAKDARKFMRMGASFVVGPQFVPGVAFACKLRRMPYIPGCGTVSEVGKAQRAGCDICKVFPGDVLGPKFVKALRAPMPWSKLMVTGGVKPERENLEGWFRAGASCVGMGSNLFPKDAVEAGEWAKISELCRNALEIIKEIKQ
ncbi:MAG: bifunctional 4-hydroxy-2-oxoglutarate aldolase/2-dehydro-3-deoxy-phosphogluconate aldolase [Bacteroidales bacterium]|nr:bifunctional 4-hydroxy-2-oxoglutarate aldolase/2-dehydro-3-deoxy-phosphogluconate aldolase [Bacteroidales bacterium]